MRVAVDATPLAGPRSGIGHFTAELLGALDAHEPSIDVVTYALSFRAWRGRARTALPPGTRVLPLPAALAVRLWARGNAPHVDRFLGSADVVHGTNFVVPPTRRAARVVSVHDLTFIHRPDLCRPEVLAVVPVVRRALADGAWAHTLTEAVAQEVRAEFGTDRAIAVHPAAPHVQTSPTPTPRVAAIVNGPPYALAIGTAEPRKNLPALVRAFATIPSLRLVIAGPPGTDTGALELLAASTPALTLVGSVTDDERAVLLRGARLVVHAAIDEGFGFPVVEAMQVGVPVVCTSTAVLREVAGDAAVFVTGSWEDAIDVISAAATDGDLRARLVVAGRERAARYSWQATAHGLADLYRTAQGSR